MDGFLESSGKNTEAQKISLTSRDHSASLIMKYKLLIYRNIQIQFQKNK